MSESFKSKNEVAILQNTRFSYNLTLSEVVVEAMAERLEMYAHT